MSYTIETVKSWKWRITKAELKVYEFCEKIDMHPQQFSRYLTGDINPSMETFDKVEGKLKELGV